GKWREAAADAARQAETGRLAEKAKGLLSGPRPPPEKKPDRILYDNLVSPEKALFREVYPGRLRKNPPRNKTYGWDRARFGRHPSDKPTEEASLIVPANTTIEVRLPAAMFRDREFVVEGKLDTDGTDRVVQFQVSTTPPTPESRWDGKSPLV